MTDPPGPESGWGEATTPDPPVPGPLSPVAAEPEVPPAALSPIAAEPTASRTALSSSAVVSRPVSPPPDTPPPLITTRALLATSFELLTATRGELRRASFYIGGMVLGLVGPLALAVWGLLVVGLAEPVAGPLDSRLLGGAPAVGFLALLAVVGVIIAIVESRTLAVAILGGVQRGRPVTLRQAVARSRRTFWSAIAVGFLVGVPVVLADALVDAVISGTVGRVEQSTFLTSTIVSAVVGAPIAYTLAGVVLGGVGPIESVKRSIRVFRARPAAAVVVAGFETVAALLLVLGLDAGLEVVVRVLEPFGVGSESGPAGLAIVTMLVVIGTFALGTLFFTVYALTVAPQVVMFVGLTHATFGLDTVRPGGADDPDATSGSSGRRFRWYTRSMLSGFALGAVGLALAISAITG